MSEGWIGVDLDGTLATYDHWRGEQHIGEPIPPMIERVKKWLAEGRQVRIFTARACGANRQEVVLPAIEQWCLKHIGQVLPVTNQKDYEMQELWDDRCVQVLPNTGHRVDGVDDITHPGRNPTQLMAEITARKHQAATVGLKKGEPIMFEATAEEVEELGKSFYLFTPPSGLLFMGPRPLHVLGEYNGVLLILKGSLSPQPPLEVK